MSMFVNKRVYIADKGLLDRMWCVVNKNEGGEKGTKNTFHRVLGLTYLSFTIASPPLFFLV